MLDIRDDKQKVGAFLNPVRKDVRNFALSIIREIVKNYDIDAYALDYCRYPADNSDFSNGVKVHNYVWSKLGGTIGKAKSLNDVNVQKAINLLNN